MIHDNDTPARAGDQRNPARTGAVEVLLARNGFEVVRDPDSGRVSMRATDYHTEELTIDREFIDRVIPAVRGAAGERMSAGGAPGKLPSPPQDGHKDAGTITSIALKALPWVALAASTVLLFRKWERGRR